MVGYDSIFMLINPTYNVAAGVIECKKGKIVNSPGGNSSTCSSVCSSDNTDFFMSYYSTNEGQNLAITFNFVKVSGEAGYLLGEAKISGNSDDSNIYYGDYVKLQIKHQNLSSGTAYYASYSNCGQSYPLVPSSRNYISFKITTPPGQNSIDGTPLNSSSHISLLDEGNLGFLFLDTSSGGGLIVKSNCTSSDVAETNWLFTIISSSSCFAPDISDYSLYHPDGYDGVGDLNYGKILITDGGCPSGTKQIGTCPDNSWKGMCAPFQMQGVPANPAIICQSEWSTQTTNPTNQMMCCSGLWASSDKCHPYYCPQNTGTVPVHHGSDTSCPEIMLNACSTSDSSNDMNWMNNEDACDNYAAVGDLPSAKGIVSKAVSTFYKSHDLSNKSDRENPFVRKAINLCNLFPGACDDTLTSQCSQFTWADLDPEQYQNESNNPNGTNLIDTCGCFLPSDQYVLSSQDNITKPCNTICGMPNAVKPYDSSTPANTEQCGGTTCVIDSVTFNSVDSSNGGFSLTQACSQSGSGPFICYLGNDIDLDNTGYGNVQIQQNCDECYIFDPSDTSKQPEKVNCAGSGSSGPIPSNGTVSPVINFQTILTSAKSIKWVLLGGAIFIIILLVFIVIIVK